MHLHSFIFSQTRWISATLLAVVFACHAPSAFAAGLLYVLDDVPGGNQIYGYSVDESSGALTLLSGFPVATGGSGDTLRPSERLTIDRTNLRLYAINGGSTTLSAYAINPASGALTPLPFSPVALGAGQWRTVAVHPSGSPVLTGAVLNNTTGLLASFKITATTATAASGSPYDMGSAEPFSMVFSHDGNFVYSGGQTITTFAGFSVNATTGVLTTLPGSPFDSGNFFPVAYAADSAGRLFMANAGDAQARVFTTSAGVPAPVAGNPFATGLNTEVHGVLHPNGFYMLADRGSNGALPGNQVDVFQIAGSGSATTLNLVAGSPFATGGTTSDALALNGAGTFLFAANGDSRNLSVFPVNPATGVLSVPTVQAANTLGTAGRLGGMAYLPSLSLAPTALPAPDAGTFYNQMLTASGGTGPYTFAVTAGALPPGLSLSADGVISGMATQEGEFTFTISVTESNTVANPVTLLTMFTVHVDFKPVFSSGPSINPNPSVTDLETAFMTTVEPADASVVWDFGDGSTSVAGLSVKHTYNAAGTFNVSVTATNPRSGSAATVVIPLMVGDAQVLPGTTAALGTKGTLKFAAKADSVKFSTSLQLAPGQTVEGLSVMVSLNGLMQTFVFNKRGVATVSGGSAHLSIHKKAARNGTNAKLSVALTGQLKTALSMGVTLDASGLPEKLLILIQSNGQSFSAIERLTFKRGQARF